jgi:hypothetical protein
MSNEQRYFSHEHATELARYISATTNRQPPTANR